VRELHRIALDDASSSCSPNAATSATTELPRRARRV